MSQAVKFAESIPVREMPIPAPSKNKKGREQNEENEIRLKQFDKHPKQPDGALFTGMVNRGGNPTVSSVNSPSINNNWKTKVVIE